MKQFLAFAAVVGLFGQGHAIFFDDFNRADGPLGSNWNSVAGNIQISNNSALESVANPGLAVVDGVSVPLLDQVVSVDVFAGASEVNYSALVLGYLSSSQNIFIKVQKQGGSADFNFAAFYTGNNGSSFGSGGFFELDQAFSSGRITAWFSDADTVHLGIDSDFSGTFNQVYSSDGVSALTLGTGVGMGSFNGGVLDNYEVVPEPATMLALGAGLAALAARRRKNKA